MNFRLAGRAWLSLPLLFAILLLAPVTFLRAAPSETLDASQDMAVSQILNGILSYARWPAGTLEGDTLRLCLIGSPRHAEFLGYHSAIIDGRRIVVERKTPADLPGTCNALYTGALDHAERDTMVRNVVGKPVLVISERGESCSVTSMFCLTAVDRRVTFEINLDAVARSGIRIHPSVLKLARPQVRP